MILEWEASNFNFGVGEKTTELLLKELPVPNSTLIPLAKLARDVRRLRKFTMLIKEGCLSEKQTYGIMRALEGMLLHHIEFQMNLRGAPANGTKYKRTKS